MVLLKICYLCEFAPIIFSPLGGKKIVIQCPCFLCLHNLLNGLWVGSCLFGLWLGSRSQIQLTSFNIWRSIIIKISSKMNECFLLILMGSICGILKGFSLIKYWNFKKDFKVHISRLLGLYLKCVYLQFAYFYMLPYRRQEYSNSMPLFSLPTKSYKQTRGWVLFIWFLII